MKNDPIRTKVLSIRLIPNADRFLLKAMQVQEGHRSLSHQEGRRVGGLCKEHVRRFIQCQYGSCR